MRPDMYPDLKMWYQAMYELTCENSRKVTLFNAMCDVYVSQRVVIWQRSA